ncbi:hypothetical protein HK099_001967 [Clydaea vesicula]|uniref:Microsomal glutathione S-transferase 3 n=1 Tax=Clydaea vesicula TaxID=447962 RepID=A0AAD5U633_9FUNG|nr:hypothetical protein HK099_001967 [Clydaea vesicula]KAJ3387822.1 hypothetical protein HDU92_001774 [Lobulomyces angularis]
MSTFTTITFDSSYGYVLFTIVLTQLQCMIAGISVAGQRKKHGVKYPDMGCGIHAMKLKEKDWEEFNNYQRVHYNYLEDLSLITIVTLISSLKFPILSAQLNFAYVIGRYFYGRGYKKSGASGRLFGVLILDVAKLSLICVALYNCYTISGLKYSEIFYKY